MPAKITVLLPVYNEEANVLPVYMALKKIFSGIPQYNYEIIFADDGSQDNTLSVIKKIAFLDHHVFYVSFSRNFGKDNALMAGLQHSTGDALITIDADLQHPPELIPELIKWWDRGFEVVYTFRKNKNKHAGIFNQFSSKLFYKAINSLSDVHMENGISDYRLMDKKVVNSLINLNENNPFFRGLLKWVGFKQKGIPYTPNPREKGETKYKTSALLKLALQGITSFSTKPLIFAIYLGFFFSLTTVLYIPYVLYSIYIGVAISGWASTIVTIVFFGGMQLMIMGIIGLYLGKVFMQVKERPQFIISESNFVSQTATAYSRPLESNISPQ